MNDDEYWIWGTDADRPRILHTMIRVADLDRSLEFYCGMLGMRLLSRVDVEAGRFTIVFIGYQDYSEAAVELTYNWDGPDGQQSYTHGSGYGHFAIGVPDIYGFCEQLKQAGVEITVEPKTLLPGAPALAFVKDPDGYAIELIQTSRKSPRQA